jgi:cysteine desulfurase/selenocysteine lyase
MLDTNKIRKDFPIFDRKIRGWDLVFLDSAASSQKPNQVIDTLSDFYRKSYANIHRGLYVLSMESTHKVEQSRKRAARFVNAPESDYVPIFVRGATEGINLFAQSWGRSTLQSGDEIVVTEMEHHANLVPWQVVAEQTGAVLKFAQCTTEGRLDLDHFWDQINDKTKFVAMTHASNVLGTINPVEEIVPKLKERGILALIDGAQAVPGMPVDLSKIGCAAYTFSAHKMLGPTGIGLIFIDKELAQNMPPYQTGGGQIKTVDFDGSTYADPPARFEPGTPAIAEITGLSAAMDYLDNLGLENVFAHEKMLTDQMIRRLSAIDGLKLFGPQNSKDRMGVVSFEIEGVHAHDLGMFLDFQGVCVRVGHHCAQPLMRKLGTQSTTRASVYVYNSPQDVERLVSALREAKAYFLKSKKS